MKIDVNILRGNVNPPLQKAQGILKDCNSILSSIVIPSDFEDAGKVREAGRKLLNIISILNIAQSNVEKSVSNFDLATAQNNQIIDNLLRKPKQ